MKKLTIRLPDDLNAQLVKLAQAHQRSANRQVVWLIEQAVKSQDRSQEAAEQNKGKP